MNWENQGRSENLEDRRYYRDREGNFDERYRQELMDSVADDRVRNELWNLLEGLKNSVKDRFDDPEAMEERLRRGPFKPPANAVEALRRAVGWDENWTAPQDWNPPDWMGTLLGLLSKPHWHVPGDPKNEPGEHYPRREKRSPWSTDDVYTE